METIDPTVYTETVCSSDGSVLQGSDWTVYMTNGDEGVYQGDNSIKEEECGLESTDFTEAAHNFVFSFNEKVECLLPEEIVFDNIYNRKTKNSLTDHGSQEIDTNLIKIEPLSDFESTNCTVNLSTKNTSAGFHNLNEINIEQENKILVSDLLKTEIKTENEEGTYMYMYGSQTLADGAAQKQDNERCETKTSLVLTGPRFDDGTYKTHSSMGLTGPGFDDRMFETQASVHPTGSECGKTSSLLCSDEQDCGTIDIGMLPYLFSNVEEGKNRKLELTFGAEENQGCELSSLGDQMKQCVKKKTDDKKEICQSLSMTVEKNKIKKKNKKYNRIKNNFNLPADVIGRKCLECNKLVTNTDHFRFLPSCSKCNFKTCCAKIYTEHMIAHGKNRHKNSLMDTYHRMSCDCGKGNHNDNKMGKDLCPNCIKPKPKLKTERTKQAAIYLVIPKPEPKTGITERTIKAADYYVRPEPQHNTEGAVIAKKAAIYNVKPNPEPEPERTVKATDYIKPEAKTTIIKNAAGRFLVIPCNEHCFSRNSKEKCYKLKPIASKSQLVSGNLPDAKTVQDDTGQTNCKIRGDIIDAPIVEIETTRPANVEIVTTHAANVDIETTHAANVEIKTTHAANVELETTHAANFEIETTHAANFEIETTHAAILEHETTCASVQRFDNKSCQSKIKEDKLIEPKNPQETKYITECVHSPIKRVCKALANHNYSLPYWVEPTNKQSWNTEQIKIYHNYSLPYWENPVYKTADDSNPTSTTNTEERTESFIEMCSKPSEDIQNLTDQFIALEKLLPTFPASNRTVMLKETVRYIKMLEISSIALRGYEKVLLAKQLNLQKTLQELQKYQDNSIKQDLSVGWT